MSEKFSLKWSDFLSEVSQSFSVLRVESDFYDVTLVSDDHTQISAHKLALSASSLQIYQNELDNFLEVPQKLKIDGLLSPEELKTKNQQTKKQRTNLMLKNKIEKICCKCRIFRGASCEERI